MPSVSPLRAFLLSVLASIAYKLFASAWLPGTSDVITSSLHEGQQSTHPWKSALVAQPIVTVNGSLPVLPKRATPFSRAFKNALELALREATEEVDRHLDPLLRKRMRGVPGTAIKTDEEAQRLQSYLDCASGQGRWTRDESGTAVGRAVGGVTVHKQSSSLSACDKRYYKGNNTGAEAVWNVRDDLKWTWEPDQACHDLLPPELLRTWQARADQIADLPSRRSLCQLLRHKNILLVGDAATQYPIHDLVLDWTSDKPLTCYGDLFCNEHGICGGRLAEDAAGEDTWEHDDTVNDRLPTPAASGEPRLLLSMPEPKPRQPNDPTYGTILRYRRSDGLYLRTSPSMPGHDAHFSHPGTSVREINNYALADARRSDVVLINKAPLPMPLAASYYGNWTVKLEAALPADRPVVALRLALAMTVDTWLIDLLDSLSELRDDPSPKDQLIIYRSSWRTAAHCGKSGDEPTLPVGDLPVSLDAFLRTMGHDAHVMLHDFQVLLQNQILRQVILPQYSIPFLDLETLLGTWQGGFVLGKSPQNCLQPCIPGAGMALERALIGGLWKVMAWGWAKDDEAIAAWMGDAFVPLRKRHHVKNHARRRK